MDANNIIKLLEVINGYCWPVVALIAIFSFKRPVTNILDRISEVTFRSVGIKCKLSKADEVTKIVKNEVPLLFKMANEAILCDIDKALNDFLSTSSRNSQTLGSTNNTSSKS